MKENPLLCDYHGQLEVKGSSGSSGCLDYSLWHIEEILRQRLLYLSGW